MSRRYRTTLLLALVFLTAWLPRRLAPDRFVTPDEKLWLARSANFYYALAHRDFVNTFQREHPGVTAMWAGATALAIRYPEYVQEAPGQLNWETNEFDAWLKANSTHTALELLVQARVEIAMAIALLLTVCFWLTLRLFDTPTALLGTLLIALDPFHLALSRQLHLDGLLSVFSYASVLAFLVFLYRGRQIRYLGFSGVLAAVAILTKSPAALLLPFVGLLTAMDMVWRIRRDENRTRVLCLGILSLIVWTLFLLARFMLGWPALWVEPLDTLRRIFPTTVAYATGGHKDATFFLGKVIASDPGLLFYPIALAFRSTPVTIVGLVLAASVAWRRFPPFADANGRRPARALALYALLFAVGMSLVAKKFDRYLLPIFPALDMIAALGWVGAARWLHRAGPGWSRRQGALAAVVAAQAFMSLSHFPYYFTYFNPLIGGARQAAEVMMVGWGEGLDQAARYLNEKPNADRLKVAAWYAQGPLDYYFDGRAIPIRFADNLGDVLRWMQSDYAVLYINQWQRQAPLPELLDYFNDLTPEKTIRFNGLDYVRIYNLQDAPTFDYLERSERRFTDWGGAIRLVDHDSPEVAQPGQSTQVAFQLQNLAPLDRDLNVLVRLVGAGGRELARDEGWPFGSPTSVWKLFDVWPDGHRLAVPSDAAAGYYRLELSFYDPATLAPLPATDARTGAALGDAVVVDYISIGDLPTRPAHALSPPADFAQEGSPASAVQLRLLGSDIGIGTGERAARGNTVTARPGEPLHIRLFWQAQQRMTTDYTVFVHLVGPDGQLLTQRDSQPVGEFFPTSFWKGGQPVADDYDLAILANAQPGTYEIRVGMYDLATGRRLQVSRLGNATGDYVAAGTVWVR